MSSKKAKLPLSVTHPELAKQASGWEPDLVTEGNSQSREWKCEAAHTWKTSIYNRIHSRTGCPVCNGKRLLPGFNDLATRYPAIGKEASGWDSTLVLSGSNENRDWKCPLGHKYSCRISHRTLRNIGCPICSNHQALAGFNDLATTHPHLALELSNFDPTKTINAGGKPVEWKCQLGHIYKMRISDRKKGDGCPFCSNRKLLIGFNDLLTTNPKIAAEADNWDPTTIVAGSNSVQKWKCKLGHKWSAQPNARLSGKNCPYCANQKVWPGFNDLETTNPQLARQAVGWDPKTILAGNDKLREWRCPDKHIFKARVTDLVNGKTCGVCANRQVQTGYNDLATKFPQLAQEADGWDPTQVVYGSNRKFTWICQDGHRWRASLVNRTYRGDGCPSCAKYGYDINKDAYIYFLQHDQWQMLQIGITNVPEIRLTRHFKLGWELLELRGPMDGQVTKNWETAILKMLRARGADLSNSKIAGKFDGYTEAWSKKTIEVDSIKELMKMVESWEANGK